MKIFTFVKKSVFSRINNFIKFYKCVRLYFNEKSEIININSNNPIFYPFSIKINKCSGNCNNINNPYAKICVPDAIKDLNVKVFNLMSRTNENRFIKWNEKCKCKCRLDAIASNDKQRWNKNVKKM